MEAPQITQIGLRFSRLIKILTYTRHQFTKKEELPQARREVAALRHLRPETFSFFSSSFKTRRALFLVARKSLGHLQFVPWVSVPRRTVLLWAGRASGNRIRAAAGFPAALLVPRNQIGEPQDARSPRPGCAEGRVPGAYRICSAFQAVGAGEIWLLLRACNRLDTSSGWPERPSALSLSPERAQPSLSLPRPRTGQGPETLLAIGGRGGGI